MPPQPCTSKNRLYSTTFSFEHSFRDPVPLPATAETTRHTRHDSSDSPGSSVSRQNKGPAPFGAEPSLHLTREAKPVALSEASSLYRSFGTVPIRERPSLVQFRRSTGSGSAHSPFLLSRASFSNRSSTVSTGVYFRYHQHQPSL